MSENTAPIKNPAGYLLKDFYGSFFSKLDIEDKSPSPDQLPYFMARLSVLITVVVISQCCKDT